MARLAGADSAAPLSGPMTQRHCFCYDCPHRLAEQASGRNFVELLQLPVLQPPEGRTKRSNHMENSLSCLYQHHLVSCADAEPGL